MPCLLPKAPPAQPFPRVPQPPRPGILGGRPRVPVPQPRGLPQKGRAQPGVPRSPLPPWPPARRGCPREDWRGPLASLSPCSGPSSPCDPRIFVRRQSDAPSPRRPQGHAALQPVGHEPLLAAGPAGRPRGPAASLARLPGCPGRLGRPSLPDRVVPPPGLLRSLRARSPPASQHAFGLLESHVRSRTRRVLRPVWDTVISVRRRAGERPSGSSLLSQKS